jgi:uncharacterized glyoxalase superfamily protein PhnB
MEIPMSTLAKNTVSTIIPSLRYDDALAAIDWLCEAFGFGRHLVVEGPGGTIAHAQLTLDGGMIMLGSAASHAPDSPFGALVRQPEEAGGCTQTIYVVVADADATHDRAKAAGAEIVLPLADKPHGGRDFTCRDLEGHVWSFGTYDPWD